MLNKSRKILCLCLILLASAQCTKRLIFIQELFRHGARYPIYPKAEDGSQYVVYEHQEGELTTQGKNMHYLLGKKIYSEYWDQLFHGTQFSERYNQSKFYIKSTDVNRTIQSCQSHLMGIFENQKILAITQQQAKFSAPFWQPEKIQASEGSVFPTALQFHPLPIHVQQLGTNKLNTGDFLRAYTPQNCPKQNSWTQTNQQGSFAKIVYNNTDILKAINALSEKVNKTVTFQSIGQYYDNFQTNTYLGRYTLPIFSDPDYARTFEYIYTLDLYINLFFTKQQLRTTSTGFFEQTLKNIDRAIKSKDVQWVIYSAHDTTVGNMLAAMNLTSATCIYQAFLKGQSVNRDTCISAYPIYTASIIFEVFEDNETNTQSFKIRYGGQYRKIPFCDWELECQVSKFRDWFEQNIRADYIVNCGIVDDQNQALIAISVIEFAIIIILGLTIFKKIFYENHTKLLKPNRIEQILGGGILEDEIN